MWRSVTLGGGWYGARWYGGWIGGGEAIGGFDGIWLIDHPSDGQCDLSRC